MGSIWVAAAVPAAAQTPLQSARSLEASSSAAPLGPPGAFTVAGSNGYSMLVFGNPARKGQPSSVAIFVTGKGGDAFYSAPATVTETSLQANLGALGEIAVTFHPSGQPRTQRSDCGGKPVRYDSGSYEGKIDFHGEEGYTDVEATSAPGDFGFLLDILCPGSSGSIGGLFLPGAELDAYADGTQEGPHLKVVKNRPGTRAHYEAGVSEEIDGIVISRFTDLIAPARTFEYDPKVLVATVRPPAPFSGTAQFH